MIIDDWTSLEDERAHRITEQALIGVMLCGVLGIRGLCRACGKAQSAKSFNRRRCLKCKRNTVWFHQSGKVPGGHFSYLGSPWVKRDIYQEMRL